MIPVIDMWSPLVPSHEITDHIAENMPTDMLRYLEVFTKTSISAGQFTTFAHELERSDEEIEAALDEAGVVRAMITGFDELSSCGKTFVANEPIAALAERAPGRFIPFAGADIGRGMTAVADFEHWVAECGFRGLSLRPFMTKKPASAPEYGPFFAKCVELGVPVSIHSSANWLRTAPNELGHPRHIDEVACRFPELTIIMSHGGYPWVLESCLLAWKHPNVYLELAAHRPKYFTAPGSGWDPLLRFGQTTIAEKVLYGTGAFLLNRPHAELTEEMRALPVGEEVLEKWLWRNAARLLDLDVPDSEGGGRVEASGSTATLHEHSADPTH